MAGNGAAFELLAIEAGEEVHKIVARNRFEGELILLGERFELEHVPGIGGNCVRGQALLYANVSEISGDGSRNFHHEPANSSAVSRRVAMP